MPMHYIRRISAYIQIFKFIGAMVSEISCFQEKKKRKKMKKMKNL